VVEGRKWFGLELVVEEVEDCSGSAPNLQEWEGDLRKWSVCSEKATPQACQQTCGLAVPATNLTK
jgi:hypothetical protein